MTPTAKDCKPVMCLRCKFFNRLAPEYGQCRRNAPRPTVSPNWEWPLIPDGDWCGEFRPKAEGAA